MTLREYDFRMTAYQLQMVDEQYMCYVQSFADRVMQATKKNKYQYEKIEDAFKYEKIEKEILGYQDSTQTIDKKKLEAIAKFNRREVN